MAGSANGRVGDAGLWAGPYVLPDWPATTAAGPLRLPGVPESKTKEGAEADASMVQHPLYRGTSGEAIAAVFPAELEAWATRTAWCESTMNPAAVSWDGSSYGLFQIWQGHSWRWPTFWSEWMLPEKNAAWALELVLEQGPRIWACH